MNPGASGLIGGIIILAVGIIVLIWPRILDHVKGIRLIIIGIIAIVRAL